MEGGFEARLAKAKYFCFIDCDAIKQIKVGGKTLFPNKVVSFDKIEPTHVRDRGSNYNIYKICEGDILGRRSFMEHTPQEKLWGEF